MKFDNESQTKRREHSKRDRCNGTFLQTNEGENRGGEQSSVNLYNQSEKRRRLTKKQVEFLEKSFKSDYKLDQVRKENLAKEIGLQPKQVVIWFQNRRTSYRSKQLVEEYGSLKASYDQLQYDYDSIIMERDKLQNEVDFLKMKLAQQKNISNTNTKEQGMSTKKTYENMHTNGELVMPSNKQTENVASSSKSHIFDFESSPYEQFDLSPDDEEYFMMSKNLLFPQTPPTFNNFLKN